MAWNSSHRNWRKYCTGSSGITLPPLASEPPIDAVWPLVRVPKILPRFLEGRGPNGTTCIGFTRSSSSRWHAGIDLGGQDRDKVLACEDGEIIRFKAFHPYNNRKFWVWALFVKHANYIINYAEVNPILPTGLKVGSPVSKGQHIASLKKMNVQSMLHFEMYTKELESTWGRGGTGNEKWPSSQSAPAHLLDPTNYLLILMGKKERTSYTPKPEVTTTSCT